MDQDVERLDSFSSTAGDLSTGKAKQVPPSPFVPQLPFPTCRNGCEDAHLICKVHRCHIEEKTLLLPSRSKIGNMGRDLAVNYILFCKTTSCPILLQVISHSGLFFFFSPFHLTDLKEENFRGQNLRLVVIRGPSVLKQTHSTGKKITNKLFGL